MTHLLSRTYKHVRCTWTYPDNALRRSVRPVRPEDGQDAAVVLLVGPNGGPLQDLVVALEERSSCPDGCIGAAGVDAAFRKLPVQGHAHFHLISHGHKILLKMIGAT